MSADTTVLAVFGYDVLTSTMPTGELVVTMRLVTDDGTYDLPMDSRDAAQIATAVLSAAAAG